MSATKMRMVHASFGVEVQKLVKKHFSSDVDMVLVAGSEWGQQLVCSIKKKTSLYPPKIN